MNNISADRPISSSDEDVLGRSSFAKKISTGIVQLPASNGFVLGLTGQWGVGKSSTIEMILEWIYFNEVSSLNSQSQYLDEGQVNWSERELIALSKTYRQHFSYLDKDYEDETLSARGTARWHLLDKIGKVSSRTAFSDVEVLRYFFLKHLVKEKPKTIVFRFSPWLIPEKAELVQSFVADLFLVISRFVGEDTSKAARAYIHQVFTLIGTGADIIGEPVMKKASDALVGFAKPRTKTLDELKSQLESKLRGLGNRRILIVIDDLDRMPPTEAVQMISLVKSLGDLPNIIYLLSYDASIVTRQLEKVLKLGSNQGEKYLQKIIQLSFELDQPRDNELYGVFSVSLKKMVPEAYDDLAENLRDAWFYVISDFVNTPRDAARIVNKYLFLYSALSEITDPVDLLVLTVTDVMDSDLYRWIQENQVSLSKDGDKRSEYRDYVVNASRKKDENASRLDKILKMSGSSHIDQERNRLRLLEFLFPNVFSKKTLSGLSRKNVHHSIEKIANTANYFKLSDSVISWPRSLLEQFKEQDNYIEMFEEILNYIAGSSKEGQSLLRIRIIEEMYGWIISPNFHLYEWLDAVLVNAPYFIRNVDEVNWDDNFSRLYQLITTAIKHKPIEDYSRLFSILADEQYDFSLPSTMIWRLLGSGNPNSEYVSNYNIDSKHMGNKQLFLNRCIGLLRDGELFLQAAPSRILTAWWAVSDTGLDQKRLNKIIEHDLHPQVFFELNVTRSTGGDYIRHNSKEILSSGKIYEMALRVLQSERFDRKVKLDAQTYIERYRRGLEEWR